MADTSTLGIALGVTVVIIFIVLAIISKSIFIVQQAEAIVIERLGKFHRILTSGIHFIVPYIDAPRPFTWRKTYLSSTGEIKDTVTTLYRIDKRESVFNFLRQECFTKDTVQMDVNALMYYKIHDVMKAVYEVDDLQVALSNTAQTQLKEVFGNMTFSEALESQAQINDHLSREFSKLFHDWGITVERMELLDLSPDRGIQENMKKQMMAERQRRGEFIRSEGKKAAMRLKADGAKGVSVNIGLAKQESTRKRSEGEYEATVLMSTAERNSLEALRESFADDGTSQSSYLIAQRYIKLLGTMMQGAKQHLYLPYEITSIRGLIGDLTGVFGSKNNVNKNFNNANSGGNNNNGRRSFRDLD